MNHPQFFNKFFDDEVDLNPSRLRKLNDSVKAISEFLSRNLDSYIKIERQGSYALRTIIKPVRENQGYDADILLYMKDMGKYPRDYINELCQCLRGNGVYAEKARRKTRCVVLDYAGDFHLDIVPCVPSGNGNQKICNDDTNEFEQTDGTGYRDWFNDKNNITHGNLKRITGLLKYLRDHKGNFTAKSILLTTLIGNTVRDESDSDLFRTLPDALKTVSNRINGFLQSNRVMPRITNPALPEEDFTRHWDQKKYAHFRDLFKIYNDKINEAFDAVEHDDSIEKWRNVFGDNFGKKQGDGGDGSSSGHRGAGVGTVTVTPRKPYAR